MSQERRQILQMVADGTIKVDEAERLLTALREGDEAAPAPAHPAAAPRYLRVVVDGDSEKVNVRVPMQLIRAGMKFSALIPKSAQAEVNKHLAESGIDFDLNKLRPQDVEELIRALAELQVDVDDGEQHKVRVFCE